MRPVWHPLSTVLLDDPPCFATLQVLRLLLRSTGALRLTYAGDRMWPTVAHGASFSATPIGPGPISAGTAVVACPGGIPDLLRVVADHGERLSLAGDADPQTIEVARADVLAGATVPVARSATMRRTGRRVALDLSEAWRGKPDGGPDPAETVREKYDSQAESYARTAVEFDSSLLARIRNVVGPGRLILVIGSGTGHECFALAQAGFRVKGLEFSKAMVKIARGEAQRRGVAVEFREADLRDPQLCEADLGGVLFTYDVYSFLPHRAERVQVLRRIRSWLAPEGAVFLSARRAISNWERAVLTVQWLAGLRRGEAAEWGDSHTRWVAADGALRRSFVRVFTERQLRAEAAEAGLSCGSWEGGHAILTTTPAAIIDDRCDR